MSSLNDPFRSIHRWGRCIAIAGAAVIVATALWALQPAPDPTAPTAPTPFPDTAMIDRQTSPIPARANPIDLDVFRRVQLWNPIADPVIQPPTGNHQVRAPLQCNLELLAIVHEGPRISAALFDPDTNRLHLLGIGEHIAGLTIKGVHLGGIIVTDGTQELHLTLKTPEAPHGPLESLLAQGQDGPP